MPLLTYLKTRNSRTLQSGTLEESSAIEYFGSVELRQNDDRGMKITALAHSFPSTPTFYEATDASLQQQYFAWRKLDRCRNIPQHIVLHHIIPGRGHSFCTANVGVSWWSRRWGVGGDEIEGGLVISKMRCRWRWKVEGGSVIPATLLYVIREIIWCASFWTSGQLLFALT